MKSWDYLRGKKIIFLKYTTFAIILILLTFLSTTYTALSTTNHHHSFHNKGVGVNLCNLVVPIKIFSAQ